MLQLILFWLIIEKSNSQENDRLVFLFTHFRHGARAPINIDDEFNDLFKEHWTNPGELTGVGQRMHYLLGLRNRIKYIENEKFLSESFDAHEILIYGSHINRSLVSVSSQLQGLYPQMSKKGEKLTEGQKAIAYPQVNTNFEEIKNEITNLGDSALPYYMTLAPVRMININERRYKVYDIPECVGIREQIKKENRETIPELINFKDNFNEKYGQIFNKYFKENKTYDINDIYSICDSILSGYGDSREMTSFKTTGLDLNETNEYCQEFQRFYFLYHLNGGDEKILAHIDSSRLMEELIYYMKRRIDADITEEDEDANFKDYSRPKMLMISGHDSTISADEVFIIRALNLKENETYIYPRYASQLAIEVRTKNDNKKKSSYSDYYVVGYIDDKEIFNVSADSFINKLRSEIWDDVKIGEYCTFDDNDNIYYIRNNDKTDNAKTAYKVLMIVFICLSAILLVSTIVLAYKLSKKNNAEIINANNISTQNIKT